MHRTDTTDRTSSGVVKTGGITAIGSGIITGLTVATDINVGDWVTMDKGFDTQRYKVLATAAAQITVDGVGTSNETGVTVTVVADMYTVGDGLTINRTIYGPDQANAVQEEIVNTIEAAGLSPTKNDNTQLRDSVVPSTGGIFVGTVEAREFRPQFKSAAHTMDSSEYIRKSGARYDLAIMSPATSYDLLSNPGVSSNVFFGIDILMYFRRDGGNYFCNCRVIIPTRALGDYVYFMPQRTRIQPDLSGTDETENGGTILVDDHTTGTPTDAEHDGAGGDLQPIFMLAKSGAGFHVLKVRNGHASVPITDVIIFLQTFDSPGLGGFN